MTLIKKTLRCRTYRRFEMSYQRNIETIKSIKGNTVISGIRNTEEVEVFRKKLGNIFKLIAVEAPIEIRYSWAKERQRIGDNISLDIGDILLFYSVLMPQKLWGQALSEFGKTKYLSTHDLESQAPVQYTSPRDTLTSARRAINIFHLPAYSAIICKKYTFASWHDHASDSELMKLCECRE